MYDRIMLLELFVEIEETTLSENEVISLGQKIINL